MRLRRAAAAPPHRALHLDDRARVETQPGVPTPLAQLTLQPFESIALARWQRPIVQAIDDRQFEIAHAASRLECEEGARIAEGNDMHARQMPEDRAIHHDERSTFANRHQLGIRLPAVARLSRRRFLLEHVHDRPGDVFVDAAQSAYDFFGKRERHHLTRTSELRRPAALAARASHGEKVYLTRLAPRPPSLGPLVHPGGDRARRGYVLHAVTTSDILSAAAVRLPDPALVADVRIQDPVSDCERLQQDRKS